jgi:galactose-1-phosphate uridylyltransferase
MIEHLPELIAVLPEPERTLANRLFAVVVSEGTIVPPPEMYPWLERTFGSVDATLHQRIVRVTNRWTFEGTTFNPLRSHRPGASATQHGAALPSLELDERIAASVGDDFCDPERKTPADTFGRVRGRHVVTSANVAKADGWHAVGIFDRHNPLAIDDDLVADILETASEWAARVRQADPSARHFFLFWNCLWRAGASQIHGHVQITLSAFMPHARVELWRAAAARYRRETGADYFADLAVVHRALGLSAATEDDKVERFVSLTPIKEREIVLLAPTYATGALDLAEPVTLADPLAATLHAARDTLGVHSFNLAVFGPPLSASAGHTEDWDDFPLVARFVDRGNLLSPTSDIGALELFGSSVVATDPFDLARTLRDVAAGATSEDGEV